MIKEETISEFYMNQYNNAFKLDERIEEIVTAFTSLITNLKSILDGNEKCMFLYPKFDVNFNDSVSFNWEVANLQYSITFNSNEKILVCHYKLDEYIMYYYVCYDFWKNMTQIPENVLKNVIEVLKTNNQFNIFKSLKSIDDIYIFLCNQYIEEIINYYNQIKFNEIIDKIKKNDKNVNLFQFTSILLDRMIKNNLIVFLPKITFTNESTSFTWNLESDDKYKLTIVSNNNGLVIFDSNINSYQLRFTFDTLNIKNSKSIRKIVYNEFRNLMYLKQIEWLKGLKSKYLIETINKLI